MVCLQPRSQSIRTVFEFWIGIDNPLPGFHLRHYDRDRHLIEKMPELLALQSVRQIGRGEHPFDLVGFSFFRHADPGNRVPARLVELVLQ
jgi:hypothetical protein